MNRHPLLKELINLRLPHGDYALFGSGPLLARGWIEEVGDLDVIARGRAWDRAQQLGTLHHLDEWDVDVVHIGESITVGTEWAIGYPDIGRLINDSELIAGIPCVRLEEVVRYKRLAGRPKDLTHLAIIEEHEDTS